MRWLHWLEIASLDVRYALRRLSKNPGFAIVACLSLALGIGANTAAFGVVHAALLRALPVRDPGSLALVSTRYTGFQYSMSYPAYTYLRDHSSSLDGLIAFRVQPLNVNTGAVTDRVTAMLVSGNYFQVLGVDPVLGSAIRADDDRVPVSGGARGLVAVVSHDFWRRRLNGDSSSIGRVIRLDGHPATVIGVAPPGFHGTRVGSLPDVFVPITFADAVFDSSTWLANPRNNWLRIIGRIRAGVTLEQAQSQLTVAFRQFNREFILPLATTDAARRRATDAIIVLEGGRSGLLEMGSSVRPSLYILSGLVALVLLIACVNVANLMVARAERSHRDTAIAMALGASGTRLWSQNVVESVLIATTGVGLGLILATWMRNLLVQLLPPNQELEVTMSTQVFAVATTLGAVTALGLGSITAWQSTRVGVIRALKGTDLAARLWLRKGLIVGQLALSIVVLVGAALFSQTLNKLRAVDPGFDRARLLIASVAPRGYSNDRLQAFYSRLLTDVRALPGVQSAATADHEPLDVNTGWNILVKRDSSSPPQPAGASVAFVSPDYFKTMGIELVRGRDFDARDGIGQIIVNEHFVREYLGNQDAIGAQVTGNGGMTFEILGVVRNSASMGLRDLEQHMMYLPGGRGVLHVRTAVPPMALAAAIESTVHQIDPDVPVFNVRTVEQQFDRFLLKERTFATLSSTFGVFALVLSALGLYGVITHAVNRRTKEMGIRLALGAEPARIVHLVLTDAVVLIVLGVAVGLPCAFVLGRTIGSLLYGVEPGDWRSVTIAVSVLAGVATAAAWIPARRAARVDPLVALRAE